MTLLDTSYGMEEMVFCARRLRERLLEDPHRPRYHFVPPEGFFNDANGAIYWRGRYHLFYLARTPIPDPADPGREVWVEVWDHASSRDLIHWVYHTPALRPALDGSTPQGIFSGDAVERAPLPTLIYHVPGQGTCVAESGDDDGELEHWKPLGENPVIPEPEGEEEYVVFDPCAWYDEEEGAYYALIGNRSRGSGYEGDCTSLFRSPNLVDWEYLHPFYKSDRRWTGEEEDCACPDFFPLGDGDRHMLLMHGHKPYFQCHYYIGIYEGRKFRPERHGRMTWPGGQLAAPETLLDDRGRRIFFAWVPEAHGRGRDWREYGWASVMSLPRELDLEGNSGLRIRPVEELKKLRGECFSMRGIRLDPGEEVNLDGVRGDCLELELTIDPGQAEEVGLKVRCSPAGDEETPVVYSVVERTLRVEFGASSLRDADRDPVHNPGDGCEAGKRGGEAECVLSQTAPFGLGEGEMLRLRVFVDRSVVEVFANERLSLTQRIYPTRRDSLGVRLFTRGGAVRVRSLKAWDMAPTGPW